MESVESLTSEKGSVVMDERGHAEHGGSSVKSKAVCTSSKHFSRCLHTSDLFHLFAGP